MNGTRETLLEVAEAAWSRELEANNRFGLALAASLVGHLDGSHWCEVIRTEPLTPTVAGELAEVLA